MLPYQREWRHAGRDKRYQDKSIPKQMRVSGWSGLLLRYLLPLGLKASVSLALTLVVKNLISEKAGKAQGVSLEFVRRFCLGQKRAISFLRLKGGGSAYETWSLSWS